jgi:transcriptional regulator with GAF, ATPase, and Fis domain
MTEFMVGDWMAAINIDEKEFFRQFTLRICGSLEIEKALWRCFLYVRDFFPAEELMLTVYDSATTLIEVVATADEGGGQIRSLRTPVPPKAQRQLENFTRYPPVRIIEDMHKDDIIGPIAAARGLEPSVLMLSRLVIEKALVGGLAVRTSKGQSYTQEHARLWGMVNEPAAIALANSQRFREALRLKDSLVDENMYLQEELRRTTGEEIVGADFGLKEVMHRVRHVAPLSSPVLLLGETGTGKEVIAGAIHNMSKRMEGSFIKVNCGAIPESLIDSELFGHEKGAFTGATTQKRGRFERANGGTIFLDEIGELPLQAQVRLLRVLQEKEIERVGGSETIEVDIRIIAATHRDLENLVADGHFREDLYFRLQVFPIVIPPVRERKADIPVLVQHFMVRKAKEMGFHRIPTLAPGAMERLIAYHWPGNVREIENAIERALILSHGEPLCFEDLLAPPTTIDQAIQLHGGESLRLNDVSSGHIRRVLDMVDGRIEGKGRAAELLGMNPGTLRHRMRKLGIPFGRKANGSNSEKVNDSFR